MRIPKRYVLGAAGLAVAGACVAQAASAEYHSMKVALPDGAVANVQYTGDVAPQVLIRPASADDIAQANTVLVPRAAAMPDIFAQMDRISASMERQTAAMLRQAAQMQQIAITQSSNGAPGVTVVSTGTMPKGVHFSYVSTTTDANGCTRTVSYNSNGSGEAPRMLKTASDACDAVKPNGKAIPAKAEQAVPAEPAPGHKV